MHWIDLIARHTALYSCSVITFRRLGGFFWLGFNGITLHKCLEKVDREDGVKASWTILGGTWQSQSWKRDAVWRRLSDMGDWKARTSWTACYFICHQHLNSCHQDRRKEVTECTLHVHTNTPRVSSSSRWQCLSVSRSVFPWDDFLAKVHDVRLN